MSHFCATWPRSLQCLWMLSTYNCVGHFPLWHGASYMQQNRHGKLSGLHRCISCYDPTSDGTYHRSTELMGKKRTKSKWKFVTSTALTDKIISQIISSNCYLHQWVLGSCCEVLRSSVSRTLLPEVFFTKSRFNDKLYCSLDMLDIWRLVELIFLTNCLLSELILAQT